MASSLRCNLIDIQRIAAAKGSSWHVLMEYTHQRLSMKTITRMNGLATFIFVSTQTAVFSGSNLPEKQSSDFQKQSLYIATVFELGDVLLSDYMATADDLRKTAQPVGSPFPLALLAGPALSNTQLNHAMIYVLKIIRDSIDRTAATHAILCLPALFSIGHGEWTFHTETKCLKSSHIRSLIPFYETNIRTTASRDPALCSSACLSKQIALSTANGKITASNQPLNIHQKLFIARKTQVQSMSQHTRSLSAPEQTKWLWLWISHQIYLLC